MLFAPENIDTDVFELVEIASVGVIVDVVVAEFVMVAANEEEFVKMVVLMLMAVDEVVGLVVAVVGVVVVVWVVGLVVVVVVAVVDDLYRNLIPATSVSVKVWGSSIDPIVESFGSIVGFPFEEKA